MLQRAIVAALPLLPRPLVWRFSQRYIAGTSLDDAYRVARQLNEAGCSATIDVLGEDSTSAAQVNEAVELYLAAIEGISTRTLDCGISVKLSELGLRFDASCARDALRRLLRAASDNGLFVRIDMEDSSVTDLTLDIYREAREDYDNVGIVIQSCLRRSAADVSALLRDGFTDVRLCKGIYIEPAAIAYTSADDIRQSFRNLLVQLLESGNSRVGIATHDPLLVEHARQSLQALAVPKTAYEFQMLLGVAGPLRWQLVDAGHPLRVYVPFGERWYAYSMRRLRENPNIAGHIVKNLFKPR